MRRSSPDSQHISRIVTCTLCPVKYCIDCKRAGCPSCGSEDFYSSHDGPYNKEDVMNIRDVDRGSLVGDAGSILRGAGSDLAMAYVPPQPSNEMGMLRSTGRDFAFSPVVEEVVMPRAIGQETTGFFEEVAQMPTLTPGQGTLHRRINEAVDRGATMYANTTEYGRGAETLRSMADSLATQAGQPMNMVPDTLTVSEDELERARAMLSSRPEPDPEQDTVARRIDRLHQLERERYSGRYSGMPRREVIRSGRRVGGRANNAQIIGSATTSASAGEPVNVEVPSQRNDVLRAAGYTSSF